MRGLWECLLCSWPCRAWTRRSRRTGWAAPCWPSAGTRSTPGYPAAENGPFSELIFGLRHTELTKDRKSPLSLCPAKECTMYIHLLYVHSTQNFLFLALLTTLGKGFFHSISILSRHWKLTDSSDVIFFWTSLSLAMGVVHTSSQHKKYARSRHCNYNFTTTCNNYLPVFI